MSDEVACTINIGPRERRRRVIFGVITLVVTLAIAAALVVLRVNWLWRLALFLPFMSAATGYFQARAKT